MRGKQKKPTKSDADKKARKAEYERERYQRNKEKILEQQAKYYAENKDKIRETRQPYVEEYNRTHSVRWGDGKFRKKGTFKGRSKKYEFNEHKT